jgi:antitoxin Phd
MAMAGPTWSMQDAKNRFSAVVEAARREPQTVTKHGRAAAVVIGAGEYERLRRLDSAQAPALADMLLAMPQDDGSFQRLKMAPRDIDVGCS